MSFLKSLVQKTAEVFKADEALKLAEEAKRELERWVVVFRENYGKLEEVYVRTADEAFFHLLEGGRHDVIAEMVLANPAGFLRPAKLTAFLKGTSSENLIENGKQVIKDGKPVKIDHTYPPAPRELAEKVGEAVGAVLMARLEELGRNNQLVGKSFWVTDDRQPGYDVNTVGVAKELNSCMHALLNIADGLGDTEGFKALAELFHKMFGQLPVGVYYRLKPILNPEVSSRVRPDPLVNTAGFARSRKKVNGNGNGGKHVTPVRSVALRPTLSDQLATMAKVPVTPEEHHEAQVEQAQASLAAEEANAS